MFSFLWSQTILLKSVSAKSWLQMKSDSDLDGPHLVSTVARNLFTHTKKTLHRTHHSGCTNHSPSVLLCWVSLHQLILSVIHTGDLNVSPNAKTRGAASRLGSRLPVKNLSCFLLTRYGFLHPDGIPSRSQLDHLDQVYFWTVPHHSLFSEVSLSVSVSLLPPLSHLTGQRQRGCRFDEKRVKVFSEVGILRFSRCPNFYEDNLSIKDNIVEIKTAVVVLPSLDVVLHRQLSSIYPLLSNTFQNVHP